jgi:mannosyltransferase
MLLSEPRPAAKEQASVHGAGRMRTRTRDTHAHQAVIAIGVIATLGLVPWLGSSIYRDEGASLYSAHLSWSNLWAQSQHVDLVVLPYYVLLHFWLLVSGTIEWARVPSLLAYGATVIVAGRIGLRVAGRWCGIITAVLTAANPLLVQRALNARPYALSALTATLCAAVLVKWLHDGRQRRLWLFCVLGLATALLQIFAVLAPLSMVAAVLAARPRRLAERVRAMLWPIGAFVLATAAFAIVSVGQVGQIAWISGYSTAIQLQNARGPADGNTYDVALFAVLIVVVIVPYYLWPQGGRAMWTRLLARDRDPLALALGWAVLPTLILVLASIVHPVFWDRYATASAPGLALLFGLVSARVIQLIRAPRRRGVNGRSKPRGRWLAWAGAALLLVLALSYWNNASALNEDLKSMAVYVSDHAQPGDMIVLQNHAQTAAVNYYLDRDVHQVAVWPELGVRQRFVEASDLSVPTKPIDPPPHLWVVFDYQSAPTIDFTHLVLERYHYTLLHTRRFAGVSVLLYGR